MKKQNMPWVLLAFVVVTGAVLALVRQKTSRTAQLTAGGQNEGMVATSPAQLPTQAWKQTLLETKKALSDKNIPMLAAGVAYYATLAFFPTLAAFISVFLIVANQDQVTAAIKTVEAFVPGELAGLVNFQLKAVAGKPAANVVAAVLAIALSIWSASGGVQNLIKATNIAYNVRESRGWVRLKLISLLLVLGGILTSFFMIFLLVIQKGWLTQIGAPLWLAESFLYLRWILVAVLMAIGLAAFYRYGPDRPSARWQWVSWGAAAAIILWLIGSIVFFLYAQNFGNFSKNYGVFAGIIVLMTWLNLSALIFLVGAQVNGRLEAKTAALTYDE